MAWDEGLAQLLRDDLTGLTVVEQKMFGGLAFLLNGHMVCGVHKGGAMFRVGKEHYQQAMAIPGITAMRMGDRPMAAMVEADDAAMADDTRRGQVMGLALSVVTALPPKLAKPKKNG